MAQIGDESEAPEQAPADGSLRRFFSELVDDPDDGDCDSGDERRSDECVRDAAVMLESGDRPTEAPQDVEIGGFSGKRHGECGVGGLAIEAGTGETGSGKEVGDRFHRLEANISERRAQAQSPRCFL